MIKNFNKYLKFCFVPHGRYHAYITVRVLLIKCREILEFIARIIYETHKYSVLRKCKADWFSG